MISHKTRGETCRPQKIYDNFTNFGYAYIVHTLTHTRTYRCIIVVMNIAVESKLSEHSEIATHVALKCSFGLFSVCMYTRKM